MWLLNAQLAGMLFSVSRTPTDYRHLEAVHARMLPPHYP